VSDSHCDCVFGGCGTSLLEYLFVALFPGAFARLRKAVISFMSVRPRVTTLLPHEKF
jgi:hypothetical protein